MFFKFVLLLVCTLVLFDLVELKCEKQNQLNVKTFKIDLNKAPRDRFKEVAVYFKEPVLKWYELEK